MAHQFHIEFDTAERARAAASRLVALRAGARPAVTAECHDNQVFAWCPISARIDADERVSIEGEAGRGERFFSLFFKVEGIKSGMHHPDGLFWIRRPTAEHRVHEAPRPLDVVAPTLLAELGIDPSTAMRQDRLPMPGAPAAPQRRTA